MINDNVVGLAILRFVLSPSLCQLRSSCSTSSPISGDPIDHKVPMLERGAL